MGPDTNAQSAGDMAILRLTQIPHPFTNRYWRFFFVLMLVLLHLSAMRGAEDFWARALMLAHFGFFILWQPFMRGEQKLTMPQTIAVVGVSVGILFFLNWWLLGLWVSVLAGIVGGKVFLFRAPWLRRDTPSTSTPPRMPRRARGSSRPPVSLFAARVV